MQTSITGTLLALVLLAGGAYYIYIRPAVSSGRGDAAAAAAAISGIDSAPASGFATSSSDQTGPASVPTAIGGPRTPPAGYKEYRSEKYRFSVFYPNDLTVSQYDEGGGAETVTFQNVSAVQGFQIFVLPYSGSQISQERFRQDLPSGVMRSPGKVFIDGESATSFYSTAPTLGDMAEIWFLHRGYLFEVTALKSEAVWISDIMGSWKFI